MKWFTALSGARDVTCLAIATGLFILSVCTTLSADEPDLFYLFKDGKPQASIILPESAKVTRGEHLSDLVPQTIPAGVPTELAGAVREFRRDLAKGYGIDLPVGESADLPNRIVLEVQQTTLQKEDETRVTFPRPDVMLIQGGESGVMRTLFHILEEFGGVRYLFQGRGSDDLGTHFPPRTSLGLPRQPFSHASAFPMSRQSSQTIYGINWPEPRNRHHFWEWEMRLGAKARISHGHYLTQFVFPMAQYIKAQEKPSDEIFPMHQGQRILPYQWPSDPSKPYLSNAHRHGWQPRYGSDVVADEAVKNILAHLREHPETRSISLSVNDNRGHSDEEAGRESEAYWGWVNKVAQRVTQEYPHMMFGTYAYSMVIKPPSFKIHPNVVVYITFDWHAIINPEIRKERTDLVEQWGKLATIGPYSYEYGDSFYTLPRLYMNEMQQMVQLFHKNGARSSVCERAYATMTEGPKMYVYFKLLENPDLDMDKTIMDWCVAAVGQDAAPYLRDYYAFWDEYWRTKAINTSWWRSGRYAVYLPLSPFGSYMYGIEPGDVEHCRSLMEKVVALAQSNALPDQARRAKLLMTIFEWYEANATAAGAQFVSSDGTVADRNNAVKLLQNIPNAQKAYEISCTLPAKTPAWVASGLTVGQVKNESPIADSLTAVSRFIADPQVIEELGKLSKNKALNEELRFMARMMHANATGEQIDNMETNGGFEQPDLAWDIAHRLHGSVEISTDVAYEGRHSLKFNIQWPSGGIQKTILGAKPDTAYFFSAMVYVPDSQAVEERTVTLRGSAQTRRGEKLVNLNHTRNLQKVTLVPGKWNYVSCIIPAAAKTEAIALRMYVSTYKPGEVIYIDDVKAVPLVSEQD